MQSMTPPIMRVIQTMTMCRCWMWPNYNRHQPKLMRNCRPFWLLHYFGIKPMWCHTFSPIWIASIIQNNESHFGKHFSIASNSVLINVRIFFFFFFRLGYVPTTMLIKLSRFYISGCTHHHGNIIMLTSNIIIQRNSVNRKHRQHIGRTNDIWTWFEWKKKLWIMDAKYGLITFL